MVRRRVETSNSDRTLLTLRGNGCPLYKPQCQCLRPTLPLGPERRLGLSSEAVGTHSVTHPRRLEETGGVDLDPSTPGDPPFPGVGETVGVDMTPVEVDRKV